ncbi:MAG: CDP-diacylglycerol--glycerol-3-phosphate 3-phosphatidyltransferase [Oscillospiraceae bacterium]|nr:CDP-diacylglycerol--glycerol-3-phosphate 3-phosphatidyltransferase [Oscillospiraceae bacterium]
MTTANKITIARVALIPVYIVLMLLGNAYTDIAALAVFAAACLSDFADGYIARKYDQVTTFGKFMDPLADKLLVAAALLIFIERGQMPCWAAFIVIAREFAVTALRLVAVGGGVVIAAGFSGKVKTMVSMICLCVMMTPLRSAAVIPGKLTVNGLAVILILITTVWSGTEYFVRNAKLLKLK